MADAVRRCPIHLCFRGRLNKKQKNTLFLHSNCWLLAELVEGISHMKPAVLADTAYSTTKCSSLVKL
ncbi:hypothetical protein EXN66_Car016061 [Channa argus]|uniref:Uncharacterized protein n=1 Tax=Channa argus TaxID=215402 RepID=A0A6G1QD72_CHAAH|nr:hypothetical protein EXN66_Car016061 [Channa argus]